ncbi:unnamed protein product [Prorocentrum cordatum]|uniref:Uncharacterized protein n=1 Tax=Prorocentrum cordatum TaxID=2364126 RepID=A0ABN9SF65_9DINO|nr:unnamed protein product [Polarella glacialis]
MVKWAAPYSAVDYASTEVGCPGAPGCTWEPDECLPVQLDGLRLAAKRAWLREQLRREERAEEEHRKRLAVEQALALAAAAPAEEQPSPPKKRVRVDEEEREARELWNAVARQGVQWQSLARNAEEVDSFEWRTGGGSPLEGAIADSSCFNFSLPSKYRSF